MAKVRSVGRQAAWAGFAFIVVDLVALLAGGPLPSLDAAPSAIVSFYERNGDRLLAQAYVRGVAMALLVVFAATLVRALRRGSSDDVATAILGSCLRLVAAVELVRVAVVAAIVSAGPSSSSMPTWHAFGVVLGAVIAFPLAMGTAAVLPRLRDGFPSWVRVVGGVLALGWVLTGVRAMSTNHLLWTAGTVVTVLWGLWLLAICLTLWSSVDRPNGS